MMRRLILMRHAKSSWHDSQLRDHARPLNDRGEHDAPVMGRRLAKLGWVPERVISSDSRRTVQTWEAMAPALGDLAPSFTPDLYLAGAPVVTRLLEEVPAEVGTVLMLGHNPGFSMTVHWLTGADVDLKTAQAALLETDQDDWSAAAHGKRAWRLVELVTP